MSEIKPNICSCCQLERSSLRQYPDMGMQLCSYCELLPISVIQQEQQNPNQDSIFAVLARLMGRLEERVLQQDPNLPLRTPIHDKALALVMQMAASKMCPNCHNINACTCATGGASTQSLVDPGFWPYKDARKIISEAEELVGRKKS